MNLILLGLTFVTINSHDVTDYRKHYGLSYNQCGYYIKTFKCMTACKSIGYQVFRLNRSCKCTCHEMKTNTILPFFKWRTNGTTMTIPKVYSVQLYHVVGTLSPQPTVTRITKTTKYNCSLQTTPVTTTKITITTDKLDDSEKTTVSNETLRNDTKSDLSDSPQGKDDIEKNNQTITGSGNDTEKTGGDNKTNATLR